MKDFLVFIYINILDMQPYYREVYFVLAACGVFGGEGESAWL